MRRKTLFSILFLCGVFSIASAQPTTDKATLEKERKELQAELQEIQSQYNKIKGSFLTHIDGILHVFAQGHITVAGSQRTHISTGRMNTIHADAVAQQSAARFLFGGVNRND